MSGLAGNANKAPTIASAATHNGGHVCKATQRAPLQRMTSLAYAWWRLQCLRPHFQLSRQFSLFHPSLARTCLALACLLACVLACVRACVCARAHACLRVPPSPVSAPLPPLSLSIKFSLSPLPAFLKINTLMSRIYINRGDMEHDAHTVDAFEDGVEVVGWLILIDDLHCKVRALLANTRCANRYNLGLTHPWR